MLVSFILGFAACAVIDIVSFVVLRRKFARVADYLIDRLG